MKTKKENKNLTERTLSGIFWNFIGITAQALLQLIILTVLARLLTPEDFGVVGAAMVVIGFSFIFSQLGIGTAIVQRAELKEEHLRVGFTLSLCSGVAMWFIIWASSRLVADFFHMNKLISVLPVLSVVFILQGGSTVSESLLQRELRFRFLAVLEILSYLIGCTTGIILAVSGRGIWALVASHLSQVIVKSAGVVFFQPHPMTPCMKRDALRDLMYFGGGFTAARIANYTATQGDNLVVGRYLGPEALGMYGRAYQLLVMPATFFGVLVDKTLFPAMSRIQDNHEQLALVYRRGVASIALVSLPVSLLFFVLAPELVRLLLGEQWSAVVVPFQILSIGLLFRTSYKISDSLARATGAVYRRAWRQGIYAVLVLTGAWGGLRWGIEGVAAGVLIAITANFLFMAQLSLKLTGLSWREFITAHVAGVRLSMIWGVMIFIVMFMCRKWSVPYPFPVAAVLLVVICVTALLWWRLPRIFLSTDGQWIMNTVMAHFFGMKPVNGKEG
jgi:PST family polysaccharide transporter